MFLGSFGSDLAGPCAQMTASEKHLSAASKMGSRRFTAALKGPLVTSSTGKGMGGDEDDDVENAPEPSRAAAYSKAAKRRHTGYAFDHPGFESFFEDEVGPSRDHCGCRLARMEKKSSRRGARTRSRGRRRRTWRRRMSLICTANLG